MKELLMRYFTVLFEEKNISRAAEKLYISRQALSSSLKKMEDELGVTLFLRGKEGLSPTEYGMMLHSCLQEIESVWDAFLLKLENEKESPLIIRVGMSSLVFNLQDYQRIYGFEDMEKDVSIEIIDQHHNNFLSMFKAGDLDVFYSSGPLEDPDAISIQLTNEESVLLLSENHPLAAKERIDFTSDLSNTTILFYESSFHEQYGTYCSQHGIHYKTIADSHGVLQAQLQKRRGAFLTLGSIANRFLSPNIVVRKTVNCPIKMDPFLVYQRRFTQKGLRFIRYILGYHYKQIPELPAHGIYYCDHIIPPWE